MCLIIVNINWTWSFYETRCCTLTQTMTLSIICTCIQSVRGLVAKFLCVFVWLLFFSYNSMDSNTLEWYWKMQFQHLKTHVFKLCHMNNFFSLSFFFDRIYLKKLYKKTSCWKSTCFLFWKCVIWTKSMINIMTKAMKNQGQRKKLMNV